jgi:hypothetical protein
MTRMSWWTRAGTLTGLLFETCAVVAAAAAAVVVVAVLKAVV